MQLQEELFEALLDELHLLLTLDELQLRLTLFLLLEQ